MKPFDEKAVKDFVAELHKESLEGPITPNYWLATARWQHAQDAVEIERLEQDLNDANTYANACGLQIETLRAENEQLLGLLEDLYACDICAESSCVKHGTSLRTLLRAKATRRQNK